MSDMRQPNSDTTPQPGVSQSNSRVWKRSAIAISVLAVIGFSASYFFGGDKAEAAATAAAPSVTVAVPLEKTVTE